MFEAPPFETVGAEKAIDHWPDERNKENGPEPGQRRGRPFLEEQQMWDGGPGREISESENGLHATNDPSHDAAFSAPERPGG